MLEEPTQSPLQPNIFIISTFNLFHEKAKMGNSESAEADKSSTEDAGDQIFSWEACCGSRDADSEFPTLDAFDLLNLPECYALKSA